MLTHHPCADLAVRCTHVYLYTIMHTPSTLPTDRPGVQLQSYPIQTQWHNTGLDHRTGLGQQSPQTKYTSLYLWPWWYNTDNSQVHEPGQSAPTHLHLSYLSVCLYICTIMHTPSPLPTDTPDVQLQSHPIQTQWHNTGLDTVPLYNGTPHMAQSAVPPEKIYIPWPATLMMQHWTNPLDKLIRMHPSTSSFMLSHIHYKASIQISCLHAHCWSNKCYHAT